MLILVAVQAINVPQKIEMGGRVGIFGRVIQNEKGGEWEGGLSKGHTQGDMHVL